MEEIGKVISYFKIPQAAVVKIEKGTLRVGDYVSVKGHATDFTQKVESMQIEHESVAEATAPIEIGLKVKDRVREHDIVYKLESSEIEKT